MARGGCGSSGAGLPGASWLVGIPGQWHEGVVPGIPDDMGGGRFRLRRPIGVANPDLLVFLPGAGGSAKMQGRAQTQFFYAFLGQLVIDT